MPLTDPSLGKKAQIEGDVRTSSKVPDEKRVDYLFCH